MEVYIEIFNIIVGLCTIAGFVVTLITLGKVSKIKVENGSTYVSGKGNTVNQNNYTTIVDPLGFLDDLKRQQQILASAASEDVNPAMSFVVESDTGESTTCEVLFTFEAEDTGKNYIVYTDNTLDGEGNTKVYASIYNPDVDETKLLPIETDKEWEIIERILTELQDGDDADTIQKRFNGEI